MSEIVVSKDFEIEGILEKIHTVGYRSPFRLIVTDDSSIDKLKKFSKLDWNTPCKIEIHAYGDTLQKLRDMVGKKIRIIGNYEIHPSQKAKPGSEAESRFVTGIIPMLHFFVAKKVHCI